MAVIKTERLLSAFLDLIAACEGTSSHPLTLADGYDVIVSGIDGHHTFTDFATHPFALGRAPIEVRAAKPAEYEKCGGVTSHTPKEVHPPIPALHSTASGRYQIILPTWLEIAAVYHLNSFSSLDQDKACLELLEECHATCAILRGDIHGAVEKVCDIWASFPGNLYHQGGRSMDWILVTWNTLTCVR